MGAQHQKHQICILCGSELLSRIKSQFPWQGVTSDCRPWPRSGQLLLCETCGHMQKRIDTEWQEDAAIIYNNYDLYHLSGGSEQVLFKGFSPTARSECLLDRIGQHMTIPEYGHLLDVGCGNGELLRSFGRSYPKWVLAGSEQNDRFRKEVEGISNVASFYSDSLENIDGQFDLITLLHVLEHVSEPIYMLEQLKKKLAPDGLLIIEVPNFLENAFDLVVADHCSHFIPETLVALSERSDFEVMMVALDWVPRSISLVARAVPNFKSKKVEPNRRGNLKLSVQKSVAWLKRVVIHASEVSSECNFGVFGTATAGTWLTSVLGDVVKFFVDEDHLRTGKTHLDRQVLQPVNAPKGSYVYLALPPMVARDVYLRLESYRLQFKFVVPPAP